MLIIAVRTDCPSAYIDEISERSLAKLKIELTPSEVVIPYWPVGLVVGVLAMVVIVVSGVLVYCQRLDEHAWAAEDGGLQHSKESADLRLVAVERAMEEMIA